MKEVIVAHWNENCAWVSALPSDWNARIYHKGIDLPNTGREPSTFLHHIVTHYTSLADTTVFVQGNPYDHCEDFDEQLKTSFSQGFTWLGLTSYTSDATAAPYDNRPVAEVAKLLGVNVTFPINFARGGQFAVKKDAILQRPCEWYEEALELCNEMDGAPWCFERLWGVIFNG
jgi:hypothetical protein